MKVVLKMEEMLMLIGSILALMWLKVEWWYYPILFLGPDISLVGYLFGNKAGAACYNTFHHKGIAVVLISIGFFYNYWLPEVIGIIIFGHSSIDRMAGYGLKYDQGFKFTHLGMIGKNKD